MVVRIIMLSLGRLLVAGLFGCCTFLFCVAANSSADASLVTTYCHDGPDANPADLGFSLSTAVASPCVSGEDQPANDINNGVPAAFVGYTLLDKSDDTTSGVTGWKTAISFIGSLFDDYNKPTAGTFTITPGTGYNLTNLILAFRDGENHEDGYGAFLLSNLTGEWAIINKPQAVSHFTLYGKVCPLGGCPAPGGQGNTPLPGALPLLGSALGGVGFWSWMKKRLQKRSSV